MSTESIKLLKELKINFQNSIISGKLKKESVEKEYIDLQSSLDIYIENYNYIKDTESQKELSQKRKEQNHNITGIGQQNSTGIELNTQSNKAKMEEDSFEITQDEKELIANAMKYIINSTPRKIRIFYYKYLISKKFLKDKTSIKSLIESLIEATNNKSLSSNQDIQKVAKIVGIL